jgi:putative SOS response-associated peptidase YedK
MCGRIIQSSGPLRLAIGSVRSTWGLTPHWCSDPSGGRKPINAKAESVARLPMFREAYAQRRCIVPVDGFFEWRAIKGARAKQPYAIAMKDGSPFGLAGLWEGSEDGRVGTHLRHHHGTVQRAGG